MKLMLPIIFLVISFGAISSESQEERTDRVSIAAKAVFSEVFRKYNSAMITLAALQKCNSEEELESRLKTFISIDGKEYKEFITSKVMEMSKEKTLPICLNKRSCNDDIYLVMNIVKLMKASNIASSFSTMRLVDVNLNFCNQVRNNALKILNKNG